MSLEIICPECHAETLVRKEPVYDGFKKAGEKIFCSSCGFEFPDDQKVPYRKKAAPKVFEESDRPRKIDIFRDDEKEQNCRHCEHYVVNPFVQRCALHEKEVQATDICFDFKKKEEADKNEKSGNDPDV